MAITALSTHTQKTQLLLMDSIHRNNIQHPQRLHDSASRFDPKTINAPRNVGACRGLSRTRRAREQLSVNTRAPPPSPTTTTPVSAGRLSKDRRDRAGLRVGKPTGWRVGPNCGSTAGAGALSELVKVIEVSGARSIQRTRLFDGQGQSGL